MKLLILTAIIAAVTASPSAPRNVWPWQVGKEYHYDLDTITLTKYDQSDSNGNAFKAQFSVQVLAPGHLVAKLSNPLYAQINSEKIEYGDSPDLKYQPIQITDETFEIFVEGGRVKSFNIPEGLSVNNENLLKGLISALQVDFSPEKAEYISQRQHSSNKETLQGLYKKLESDVNGECETLYSVTPVPAQWRRELPQFASERDPIEIVKSKNFAACKTVVAFTNDVPEGAVWNGLAYEDEEKQFIKRSSESRLIVGKQGTIYQSEVLSTVNVSPLLFGKQKAEVFSHVKFILSSVLDISGAEWKKPEASRVVDSLFFTLNETTFFPKDGAQNIEIAQKLLQELTPLLQNPSNLPKADFLSKFNILVRVIGVLNNEELTQLTDSVKIAKDSKNAAKNNMWIIYRDAVAQAGFHSSFEQIKSWILTKEVQGEEAAELISNIGVSLRFTNKALDTEFFELMTNPEVLQQKFVNTSVLLAATKFFRASKDQKFVEESVITHLSNELSLAYKDGDSNKFQVYVRALANLANPSVLKVFAPYLDSSDDTYLRTQIVASLKTLANEKDPAVRAVLFSILRNTAEPYEVRVAAALNIFLAFPTNEMMRIMAHMTHEDPSTQVRAVLVNGITFAADLKDPRFAKLAKTAQSVKDFISQEKYGYRYSTNSMKEVYTSEDDIAFFRELSYIGSEDNILPKYHRSALRDRATGLTEENQITLSVSDVENLLEFIAKKLYEPNKSKVDFKFSAKDIAEKLNLKREPAGRVAGALFLDNIRQQKLITFNENDLNDFIASSVQNMEKLFKGIDVQYTKILSSKQVSVVFPLAAGVPFVFVYEEPLMYSMNGQVKIKLDKGSKDFGGSLSNQIDFTYARNIDGSVGFLDTLGDVFAVAGVINTFQFYFPTQVNTGINPGEIKLNFVLPEQDANFLHFGVWPYTSLQKRNSLSPISANPTTKLIERAAKVVSTEFNLSPLTGVALVLKGYSYSSDFKDGKVYDTDILTSIGNLMYQKDVALTEFNLNYLAKETKNKDITFSVFYDTLFNQKQSGEFGPATLVKDVSSKARREEIAKRAATGIDSAQVQLYDFSAVFDGKQKKEYVITAAVADSFVDNKVQGAFLLNGCEQINAVFKLVKPQIAPLNFVEALKNKIYVSYEADLKYGSSDNIHLKGYGERTEKYTQLLANDPLGKQCKSETAENNNYQKDCYKMIIKAHAPDYFKSVVTYKDLSPENLNFTYNAFESLKKIYSWDQEEDILNTIEDGKLEIEGQSFYFEDTESYKFTSKYGALSLNNVPSMHYYVYANAFYAPITSWERSRNWFTGYQNLPYCAVDYSKVFTFSGRSYDYSLTGSWHVVMVDDFSEWTDLVILARRPSANQEEVYISYKNEDGKYVEVDITPSSVEVKSNTEKVSDGELTTYWNDIDDAPLLQYYPLARGVQVFNINNGALRIIYDKERLIIFTAEHRSTTRGLCGQSSSQISDDFKTPYGLVDLPEYYGASFSLDGEFSDPKTAELKKEAKQNAYLPSNKSTKILNIDYSAFKN